MKRRLFFLAAFAIALTPEIGVSAITSAIHGSTAQETVQAQPPALPPAGTGAIAGTVVRQCSGNPASGCQGQGIPGILVEVLTDAGALVACSTTAADGSFWVAVLPGAYTVAAEGWTGSQAVNVQLGVAVTIELDVTQ